MKSMTRIALLLVISGTPAWGASIGLFADPTCSSCNLTIPLGTTGMFWIAAQPGEFTPVDGAEFRVVGLPPGWQVLSITPMSGATVLGNPLGAGANIAFVPLPGSCVDLYTVQIRVTTPEREVVLRVTKHSTPSNLNFDCPLITWDCGPCQTQICVLGGELFINSSRECTVGVDPSTWSQVKSLYE